jgi:porphobilinogen synthase
MLIQPRRLRNNTLLREAVAGEEPRKKSLVMPCFVVPGKNKKEAISSLPGIYRYDPDSLVKYVQGLLKTGLNKIVLFGAGDKKSPDGKSSLNEKGPVGLAVKKLKKEFGDALFLITDVCLCPYTTHGHCGIVNTAGVDNTASVKAISAMALSHAQWGADMVSPSDMMDGRVLAIREVFEKNGYGTLPIMSYAVKFASSYYGPFREAAGSSPGKGDRKSYQMDFRNRKDAIREALLDEQEGADLLMIKPALAYLDILKAVHEVSTLPLACYNVSGEYAMVMAAVAKGWIAEKEIVIENFTAFKRAGASLIFSYHAEKAARENWLD